MLEKGQELSANLTTIVLVEEQREENADVLPEDCNRGILLQVQVSIPSALLSPLLVFDGTTDIPSSRRHWSIDATTHCSHSKPPLFIG